MRLSIVSLPLDDDDHINDSVDVDDTFISGTFVCTVPKNSTEQQVVRQSNDVGGGGALWVLEHPPQI